MKKIGYIILVSVWIVSYSLKHVYPVFSALFIDYLITFGYCLGTSIIAYYEFKKEKNRWARYMFWNVIIVLGGAIITTYIIDLVFDDLIGTYKVLWSILLTTIGSLCIYFLQR